MPESWSSRRLRWLFNIHPAWRGAGGKVTYIAADWMEIRIEIPLSWRTKNYVGTIFGGSMYGAADPMFMIMLMKILGPGYTVWDKAASIRFRKPGRSKLYATFVIDRQTVDEIVADLRIVPKLDRHFTVDLVDAEGTVHATIEKTIHVSVREPRAPEDRS